MRVVIFGGAGFVGSHTADLLLERGDDVVVFDNLDSQVHPDQNRPRYLSSEVEFVKGDVRSTDAVARVLKKADAVFFLAAAVGVGQSMYRIRHYVDVNCLGAAAVLECLAAAGDRIRKVVVASSMSVYGEGKYECPVCGPVYPNLRSIEQLQTRDWEMRCPKCLAVVGPVPTPEDKPLFPTSIYAITKRDHEEMFLTVGRAYGVPTVALRYFNIYGSRQALSNPYTGVVAIFASRMLNNHPPVIYEDGKQSRDFVHVNDIAQANLLALDSDRAAFQALNVGTGRGTSVWDVARQLGQLLGFHAQPTVAERYRAGDIRHCYSDTTRIRTLLGYTPRVSLRDGLGSMLEWLRTQRPTDLVQVAHSELEQRGLVR